MLIHTLAGEYVLDDLVVHDTEAGILVGHLGQTAGVAHTCLGNGPDNTVDLLLVHGSQLALGYLSRFHQLADLLHGQKIFINQLHSSRFLSIGITPGTNGGCFQLDPPSIKARIAVSSSSRLANLISFLVMLVRPI